jgi:hypothetical protein
MRAKRCNSAKSAAIFQEHEQARFSMSVTSGLSYAEVCAAAASVYGQEKRLCPHHTMRSTASTTP